MTAKQLIAAAAACTECGKEHTYRQTGPFQGTWAAPDGHVYKSRIYEMTNREGTAVVKALRELAGQ
jgi:hypothetical protein